MRFVGIVDNMVQHTHSYTQTHIHLTHSCKSPPPPPSHITSISTHSQAPRRSTSCICMRIASHHVARAPHVCGYSCSALPAQARRQERSAAAEAGSAHRRRLPREPTASAARGEGSAHACGCNEHLRRGRVGCGNAGHAPSRHRCLASCTAQPMFQSRPKPCPQAQRAMMPNRKRHASV